MAMREENLHAGGKWETMNFVGVALHTEARGKVRHTYLITRKMHMVLCQ